MGFYWWCYKDCGYEQQNGCKDFLKGGKYHFVEHTKVCHLTHRTLFIQIGLLYMLKHCHNAKVWLWAKFPLRYSSCNHFTIRLMTWAHVYSSHLSLRQWQQAPAESPAEFSKLPLCMNNNRELLALLWPDAVGREREVWSRQPMWKETGFMSHGSSEISHVWKPSLVPCAKVSTTT